jgi:hypothetical protein
MSTTNEVWIAKNGKLHRLDLPEDTALLPTFQANDRTKPDSIQSEYSAEFEAAGTSHNHWLLGQAAASQPQQGQAYVRVPAVLTSGGVETMPLALLYIKGFKGGRYQLQLAGGNRRLIEALGEKMLSDLNFARFDHAWLPPAIADGLSYNHWATMGWGYELYDRGKPIDFENIDPFTLYPSVSAELVQAQILADAGFTADSLAGEPLFAQLNVPTPNPYVYPQKFREERALQAGLIMSRAGYGNGPFHTGEFYAERLQLAFTSLKPYYAPTAGATYSGKVYTADTLGYYDLSASLLLDYGCDKIRPGKVSCKVMLYVNGQPVHDTNGNAIGEDEHARVGDYVEETFTPSLKRYLLHPGDTVSLHWQGDDWPTNGFGPYDQRWGLADTSGGQHTVKTDLAGTQVLYKPATFTVELLEEFPQGGIVKLQQWLPEMKQLDFLKTYMLLGGLTIQTDDYRPHLHLAPGYKLLGNIGKARNWTRKRDAFAVPGRLPERDLAFRFGSYGQRNVLKWAEDDSVSAGYGDGQLFVADEVLATEYELATLPFAASEASPTVPSVLRILNFKIDSITADTLTYSTAEAKPRLTLRPSTPVQSAQVVLTPAYTDSSNVQHPAVKQAVTTTFSYFAGIDVGLQLNGPVLTTYWADLRAMLDQSRYLVENYRLTPQDITELDFSVPIWDGVLDDFFAVSAVGEYDARRAVEVKLCRINAKFLPAPAVPGEGVEFETESDFYPAEFY